MHNDYNYAKLRPLDVFCTSAHNPLGGLIRLRTAKLKGYNGLREMFRHEIANHCAIVVEMNGLYWLAEMKPDGLKISSCKDYLNNKREDLVAVKRLWNFHNDKGLRRTANELLVKWAHETRAYDYDMIKGYLGLGKDNPKEYYCSELCEVVANRFGSTWDDNQLKTGPGLIAPVEIQFGDSCVSFNIGNIYV